MIMFINRLAKDLGKEFPHLMFSTLAYQDCINPPVGLEVEQNVVIKLCANPGSQGYSYSVGANKNSKQIKLLLESWGKIAKILLSGITWLILIIYCCRSQITMFRRQIWISMLIIM